MHIKTVVGTNLKGRNFNRNFTALNVIAGPNDTGKTSLLDAVRLAWLGTTHGVGKKPGEIFHSFSSADSMTAALYFDDGASIERVWTKKGDKVSTVVRNPHNLNVPPVLLDSSEFFSLSTEARLVLLFSRLNLGKEPIQMRVGKLLAKLDGVQAARDLLAKRYQPSPDETFQAYLERVIDKLGDESKEQSAVAKRHRETAAGMIEAQVRNAQSGEAEFQEEEVRRDMGSAKQRLDELLVEKGSAEQRAAARAPSLARRTRLKEGIANYKPQAAAFETYQQGVKDADAALSSYEGKETVATAQDRVNGLMGRRSELQGNRRAAATELQTVEREHGVILQAECCPTCATKKTGWKAVTVEKYEARQKELREAIEKADADLLGINMEINAAENARDAAKSVEQGIREATRRRAEQASQLERAQTAREFIDEMTPELEDLERAFPADAENRDIEEMSHIQDQILDARESVSVQERRLQRIADSRLEAKQITEATLARDAAAALAEAYKAGQGILQTLRDEFMADAFKPLLVSVNRYAKGILKTPLEYRANNIGRVHEEKGNWIPLNAFSGSATAIVLAGVQLALGSDSVAKVAIVDELGRLDGDRKRQLLRNVAQAIAEGHLDQFIGVDVSDEAYAPLIKPADLKEQPMPLTILRTA